MKLLIEITYELRKNDFILKINLWNIRIGRLFNLLRE